MGMNMVSKVTVGTIDVNHWRKKCKMFKNVFKTWKNNTFEILLSIFIMAFLCFFIPLSAPSVLVPLVL